MSHIISNASRSIYSGNATNNVNVINGSALPPITCGLPCEQPPPPGQCWVSPPLNIVVCNYPLPPGFYNALRECGAMGGHALYITNGYLACMLPNDSIINIPLQ